MVYIKSLEYDLPELRIKTDDAINYLTKDVEYPKEKIIESFEKEQRIENIAVYRDNQEFVDSLMKVSERIIKSSGIDPMKVRYIAYGNPILTYINNTSLIHYIQSNLGLTNSRILPLMHPCAAFLSAIELGEKMLSSDDEEYILYVSGCIWKDFDERFIGFSIRGEGTGAALISNTDGIFKIIGTNVCNFENSPVDIYGNEKNGVSSARFGLISRGAQFIKESFEKFGVSAESINRIIQPNPGYAVFHDLYSYYAGIAPDKFFYNNVADGGHICDVDIIRNMKDYMNNNISVGDRIMLYTPDVETSFDINYYSCLAEKC